MSDNDKQHEPDAEELKRQLVRRVAFAGLMVVVLLGALAFIDRLGGPDSEPSTSGPTYTTPVPVPKKDVSHPVKPADVAGDAASPSVGSAAPVAPPPMPETPPGPAVTAQPVLPPSDVRPSAVPLRPGAESTPAEGTSAHGAVAPERTVSSAEPRPEPRAAPPAVPSPVLSPAPVPARLLNGYAVQAGVFADAQRAEELRAKLALNGIPSTIEARVQVGPFRTREEADAAREKMKALGVDAILLPPKGGRR